MRRRGVGVARQNLSLAPLAALIRLCGETREFLGGLGGVWVVLDPCTLAAGVSW